MISNPLYQTWIKSKSLLALKQYRHTGWELYDINNTMHAANKDGQCQDNIWKWI